VNDRIARFGALIEQQPENALFRYSLAQALEAGGPEHAAEAVKHYRLCAASRADWMMPRILLGKLLLRGGEAAAAKPILEEALALAVAQDHQDPEAELRALLAGL
jgi:predicted Zn-dependent protease